MGALTLAKANERIPMMFDDFFKPWNDWFDGGLTGRTIHMPAVNIEELKDHYAILLAVPGMKKDDFKIDVDGNLLTISSEKEENIEEKDKRFTRREYSYSSFSRTFTLPEEIVKDKIEAKYENGVLTVALPRKEDSFKLMTKQIEVK